MTTHNAAITDRPLATGVRGTARALALILAMFVLIVAGRGGIAHSGGVDPVAPDPWDGALMMTPSNLEDEAARADTIVSARVTSQVAHSVPGSINTDVTVSVEKAQKGQAGSTLTFTVQGGQIGTEHVFVGGVPNFVAGERVLLFLRNPRAGETLPHLVQIWQSKYTLSGSNALQAEGSTPLSIPQVEQRIGAVLGRQVSIGSTTNTTTTAAFTSSCPAWTASQIPVPYRVNGTLGTNIMPESAFVAATQTAWASWTSIPGVSIRSTFAGTGGDATANGDGVNVVSWGDVSSLGPNVIGVNSCVSNGVTRIDSDTMISNSVAWDLDPSDGIGGGLLSLYSVETHELGHGIGIGHPCEQATCNFNGSGGLCDTGPNTPVMCPVISTGVNKTIQQDDKDAALSFYPGGTTTPLPAGSQPLASIDTPQPGTNPQSFNVSGWAIDKGSTTGTGVDQVHIYVYPTNASGVVTGAAQFLGLASYGGSRPDVGAFNGSSRFNPSGYSFNVTNLAPGNYQLTVFVHSTVSNSFTPLTRLIKVTGPVSNVQASIDSPGPGNVGQTFLVNGWAVDAGSPTDTGVDQVHVYVYPTNASGVVTGAAQFLGLASLGGARSDVGAIFGSRFTPSGYGFNVSNLAIGHYQLTLFVHSSLTNTFTPVIRLINVTGPVSIPIMSIDTPAPGAPIGATFLVNGWAADQASVTGTGVDQVHVYVYPTNANGVVTGAAQFLGQATYGISRPDVGGAYGSRFTPSGYSLNATSPAPGNYQLTIFAHSSVTNTWNVLTRQIKR